MQFMNKDNIVTMLLPYINEMIDIQEDEVLFAIAEELGKCFVLHPEKTLFMDLLEKLAKHDETVVREEATKSLINIC